MNTVSMIYLRVFSITFSQQSLIYIISCHRCSFSHRATTKQHYANISSIHYSQGIVCVKLWKFLKNSLTTQQHHRRIYFSHIYCKGSERKNLNQIENDFKTIFLKLFLYPSIVLPTILLGRPGKTISLPLSLKHYILLKKGGV